MAGISTALVDVGTLIIDRRLKTGSTLANSFPILDLAQSVETIHSFTWVETFESLLITGVIKSAVIVLTAINAETT